MKLFTGYKRFIFIGILSIILYTVLLYVLIINEEMHPDASIRSWHDALWWSVTTLTTVGYGDLVPITTVGRFVGFIFLIGSFSFYALLIGQISSIMNKIREDKELGIYGVKWKHHAIIVGWNKFGRSVTDQLVNAGKKVVIVTKKKDGIDFIHENYPSSAVFVTYSELKTPEVLAKVNVEHSSAVFVNMDSDTEKLVFILTMKKKFSDLNYIVTLDNTDLKATLLEAGATYTLSKTDIAAKLLASYMFEPDVAVFNDEIIAVAENETMYDMKQYLVTEDNPYKGMYYEKVFYDLKKECNAVLVGIVKCEGGERKLIKNPDMPVTVAAKDYLLMLINGRAEKKVDKMFNVKEGYHDDQY
ncbi:MAG: NAD-binding protein [Cyclobacteriaceae bacterium]|nr:NAD-binding protein [Cyclobacteriaceae bacterium]